MPTLRFRLLENSQYSRSSGYMERVDYDGSGNTRTREDRAFTFSANRRTHGQQNHIATLNSMRMLREYNSSANDTMKPSLAQEQESSGLLICPTCNSRCKNLYINPGVCKHQYCLEGCVRENLMGLKNKDGLYPKGCPICICYPSSSNMCYADLLRVQISIERNQKFMEMKSEKKKLAQQVRNESSTIPEKLSGKRKHNEGTSTKHELDPYELILNLKRQKARNLISDDDHSEEYEPKRRSKKSLIPPTREESLASDVHLFHGELKDELLSVPFDVYYNELKMIWQEKKAMSRFIPFDEKTRSGLKIGAWCQFVRLVCDGIIENTFLEPHDFKRLLQISFFDHSGKRPPSFEQRIVELTRHREKYGHCNIPSIYRNHYSLGLWCARIRTIAQRVSFPKERLNALNKLGFVWDENEVKENNSFFDENRGSDSNNDSSKHEDSDDQMDYPFETDTASKNKSVSSRSKLEPIISKKELTGWKSSGTLFCRRIMHNFGLTKFTVNDLHGKRRNLRIGHPGLACIHCDHVDSSAPFKHVGHIGRYFPSTIKTLSDTKKTLFTLYKHLQRCKHVDPQELEILVKLRKDHEAERSLQKHGSQKQFFVTIWDRLYKDNADHIVQGDILERNKGRFVAEKVIAHEGSSSLISVKNNKRKAWKETELTSDIL